jgi:hypothetical protein
MSQILSLDDRFVRLSIARLAESFGMSRTTVAARLAMYGVQPDGRRNGYPVYRLKDAAGALVGSTGADAEGNLDPRFLPPQQRNAWYQSEARRLDVEMTTGQLVPAAEHEADLADMTKEFVQFLETLPDVMERDCGLAPEQVCAMSESVDRTRESFYQRIVASRDESTKAVE